MFQSPKRMLFLQYGAENLHPGLVSSENLSQMLDRNAKVAAGAIASTRRRAARAEVPP
jgi:hypothetical protein